jgi:hypothetical protein
MPTLTIIYHSISQFQRRSNVCAVQFFLSHFLFLIVGSGNKIIAKKDKDLSGVVQQLFCVDGGIGSYLVCYVRLWYQSD